MMMMMVMVYDDDRCVTCAYSSLSWGSIRSNCYRSVFPRPRLQRSFPCNCPANWRCFHTLSCLCACCSERVVATRCPANWFYDCLASLSCVCVALPLQVLATVAYCDPSLWHSMFTAWLWLQDPVHWVLYHCVCEYVHTHTLTDTHTSTNCFTNNVCRRCNYFINNVRAVQLTKVFRIRD